MGWKLYKYNYSMVFINKEQPIPVQKEKKQYDKAVSLVIINLCYPDNIFLNNVQFSLFKFKLIAIIGQNMKIKG